MQNISGVNILIVDDEQDSLAALQRLLRKEPFTTHIASGAISALDLLKEIDCKLVITDLRMPEMTGLELIQCLKKDHPDIIRIILSGTEDIGMIIDSINTGEIFRFISKPVVPDQFKQIIADSLDYCFLKSEREALALELERQNQHLSRSNDALRIISEELREREMQFRNMNDAALDPIFMINQQGGVAYANTAAERLFGFSEEEWHSIRFNELLDMKEEGPDSINFTGVTPACDIEHTVPRPAIELTALKKDGSRIPLEATTGSVMLDGSCHTVLIARDITSRIEEEKSRAHYEAIQRELEAQIEKKLLQGRIPEKLKRLSISRLMIPSGHLDGDFTELLSYSDRLFDLFVGDVMGHGIMSALTGAGLKSMVMKVAAQKNFHSNGLAPLQEIVAGVHDAIISELIELEIYATAMFIRIDLDANKLTAVDCGHNPAIHFHADTKSSSLIKGENLPIGLIEVADYRSVTFDAGKGDLLVLFSDGLTESISPDNTYFGIERLSELIERHHEEEPTAIVEKIHAAVCDFSGRNTFDDDLTCMVIRIGEHS